jgi:hypothetical protein
MKIQLRRNQRDVKGLLGGHKGVKFELGVVAKLSDEERRLATQYLPGETHLYTWEFRPKKGAETQLRFISVDSLVKGQTFECDSLGDILELESNIIKAAQEFRKYLEVALSFGGTVEVEIE